MTYKSLIKTLFCLSVILLTGMALSACSSDDDQINLEGEVIGAWRNTEVNEFIVFSNGYKKIELYEESGDHPGKYADKKEGNWYVEGSRIRIMVGANSMYATIENNKLITGYGRTYVRCLMSDVPTQAAPTGGGSSGTTDALSGTSWKLTRISGYGNDPSWYGEVLSFKSNGKVTEYFVEGGNQTGTYSISGTTLTLNNIAMVDYFGPKYSFSKTSTKLTLTADKGTNMETTFYFDKQ